MAPIRPTRRVASNLSLEDDTDFDGGGTVARRTNSGGRGQGGAGAAAVRAAKKQALAATAAHAPSSVPDAVGGTDGDSWTAWQDTARAQEIDRVRQYQTAFTADVTAARRAAVAVLRRREDKRAKSDAAYLQRVRDACGETLTELLPDTGTAATVRVGAESHPLQAAGREVLDGFRALLARYEQTNEALQSETASCARIADTHVDWDKDRAEARKLLHYGRVYGDSLVQAILVPGTADPGGAAMGAAAAMGNPANIGQDRSATAGGHLNQTGRSALGLFPRSQAAVARGETWGAAARTQMQALTGLVKTLPVADTGVHASNMEDAMDWEMTAGTGGKSVSFAL